MYFLKRFKLIIVKKIAWAYISFLYSTIGIFTYFLAIGCALAGDTFWWYFSSLVLMGLGWNFLFIGGSSLVVSVAKPEERGRVQGIADLMTTGTVAVASLTAGVLHSQCGWEMMVLSALGPVLIIAASVLWLAMSRDTKG